MVAPTLSEGGSSMLKSILLASSMTVVFFGSAASAQSLPPTPIDPARLSAIDKVLSSDAFEGRGPATRAEPKVIDYIVGQYKAIGLQPAGEKGGWLQDVPMRRFELTGPLNFTMTEGGKPVALTQGDGIAAMTEVPVDHVAIKDAPLVFVGYGVKAPERNWDDFKGIDLHGKIMVVLINDPDFEAAQGDGAFGKFDGKSMTYYGRWTYKFEAAARQGAAGVLIVHETAPAAYGWGVVKNSNTIPQFDIVRADPAASHPLLQGWIQRDVAVNLFKASGLDFEVLKKAARQADFKPVTLKGSSFSANYGVKVDTIVSHNILAKLPGTTKANQTVLYSAHWDHLGIGPADKRGDTIYNGALDNASGVSGMLEIARAFAHAPRTERTVAFMAVTAEEKGLLGSEYYGLHPIFPLATTVADLNLDGAQLNGPAHNVEVQGIPKNALVDMLAADAKKEGRYLTNDAHPEQGHFFRADHFSLAKVGVPAITLGAGDDLYKGGVPAGEAAAKDYVTNHYHQPSDEWNPNWDWRGAAIDLGLYYDLGRQLANSDIWPQWHANSEFKARRDATAAERK
jgi:Zn-dependent M28 family amino/carboxypeptidase